MPLSEHEQRLLDQIERALYAEDPKFAHAVRATDPQVHYKRRLIKAVLGFFVGVCLLMAGVVSKIIPISVVGFVVMLACCVWGVSSYKHMTGIGVAEPAQRRPRRPSIMERFEERWRRRHGDGL